MRIKSIERKSRSGPPRSNAFSIMLLVCLSVCAPACRLIFGFEPGYLDGTDIDASSSSSDASHDEQVPEQRDGDVLADVTVGTPAVDADSSDGDAGSWTPKELSSLSMWLAGDQGVLTIASDGGIAVQEWTDQSTKGNHAGQSVPARQPLYVTAEPKANGRPVLRFDGQRVLHVAAPSSFDWTSDFTVEVVAAWTNDIAAGYGYAVLLSKQEEVDPFRGVSLNANSPLPANNTFFNVQVEYQSGKYIRSAKNGLNDGTFRVLGGRRVGTRLEARVDGVLSDSTDVGFVDVTAIGQAVYIGGHEQGVGIIQTLIGDIAEVVAVGGPTTPAEIAKLESYLKTKYGIP